LNKGRWREIFVRRRVAAGRYRIKIEEGLSLKNLFRWGKIMKK
jgi:hypothetical protein